MSESADIGEDPEAAVRSLSVGDEFRVHLDGDIVIDGTVADFGEYDEDVVCDVRWSDDKVNGSEIMEKGELRTEDGGRKVLASYDWEVDDVMGLSCRRGVAGVVESLEVVSDE